MSDALNYLLKVRPEALGHYFAFLKDGGFFLADGYGAFQIHRYDASGKWLSCFGGEGPGQGTFNTPHGLWIDDRNEYQQDGESTRKRGVGKSRGQRLERPAGR